MSQLITAPPCNDTRKCFAAHYKRERRLCRVLTETYKEDGACPFCKTEEEDVPNAEFVRYIKEQGHKYRDIAEQMGVSPEHLHRLLTEPLSEKSKSRIKQAIKEQAIKELEG